MISTNVAVRPASLLSRLKRKFGGSAPTYADADVFRDAFIEVLDEENAPRWMIAAVTGMTRQNVTHRLKRIKRRRLAEREATSLAG